ncbi:hypothetical protein BC829DRAFT_386442, partial [Chytridium lagenaria]
MVYPLGMGFTERDLEVEYKKNVQETSVAKSKGLIMAYILSVLATYGATYAVMRPVPPWFSKAIAPKMASVFLAFVGWGLLTWKREFFVKHLTNYMLIVPTVVAIFFM